MKTERSLPLAYFAVLIFGIATSTPTVAYGAVTLTPQVAGYSRAASSGTGINAVTGGYLNNRTGDLARLFDQATRNYSGTGSFTVGGKTITAPAKIPLSTQAASLAKKGMRLNPYAIAGTLAAGWLLEQGFKWMADSESWVKSTPGTGTVTWTSAPCPVPTTTDALIACLNTEIPYKAPWTFTVDEANSSGKLFDVNGNWIYPFTYESSKTTTDSPATDADWEALPDPIPTVGSELPNVGYMPQGAPVSEPVYDFKPFSSPTGSPYLKPDGSTVQPMVTVSPNNTTITYNTYNTTITNSAGEPVVDAPPSDVNQDEVKDPCDSNPDRVGCANLGSDEFALTKETITLPFEVEASVINGNCPASIALPNGGSLSFASACDSMVMIKPIVLALAGVLTAFMVINVMRS